MIELHFRCVISVLIWITSAFGNWSSMFNPFEVETQQDGDEYDLIQIWGTLGIGNFYERDTSAFKIDTTEQNNMPLGYTELSGKNISNTFLINTKFNIKSSTCLFLIEGKGHQKLQLCVLFTSPYTARVVLESPRATVMFHSYESSGAYINEVETDLIVSVNETSASLRINCTIVEEIQFDGVKNADTALYITDDTHISIPYPYSFGLKSEGILYKLNIYSPVDGDGSAISNKISSLCENEIKEETTPGDTRKGEKGDRGQKGEKGEKGVQGLPGFRGRDGLFGLPGIPGRKGDKGRPGAPAPPVFTIKGEKGEPGADYTITNGVVDEVPPGFSGPIGRKRLPGSRGLPGEQGLDGLPGIIGRKGLSGYPGPRGDDGPPGLQGERGRVGLPGLPGLDGPDGLSGAPGEPGSPGPVGPPGPAGPPGFHGLSNMIPGCSNEDDCYNGNVFIYKTKAAVLKNTEIQTGTLVFVLQEKVLMVKVKDGWQQFAPITEEDGRIHTEERVIQGPPGPRGYDGMPGRKGQKGEKGQKGDLGLVGWRGEKGESGRPGFPGSDGPVGPPGRKGDRGDTGDE